MTTKQLVKKEETKELSTLDSIVKEVERELSTPENYGTVMLTAFKQFKNKQNAPTIIKQSCIKALSLGYSMNDILRGKIYFIPFGDGAQLVQSIQDVRSIAMRSGQAGKDKPIYKTEKLPDGKEKIISCEVTVYKIVQGIRVPYTAEVYFDEFYKPGKTYNGKYTPSMWDKMPRNMIAKVAEMHALRMAFPEEFEGTYIEEEFDRIIDINAKEEKENPNPITEEIRKEIAEAKTIKKLGDIHKKYEGLGEEFVTLLSIRKKEIIKIREEKKNEKNTSSGTK